MGKINGHEYSLLKSINKWQVQGVLDKHFIMSKSERKEEGQMVFLKLVHDFK
jgi:hypothetical protein